MLICLTASHKNAGFDLLERLSATAHAAGPRIQTQHPAIGGAVVVATCNRYEAYLDLTVDDGQSPVDVVNEAIRAVGSVAGLEPEELRTTFGFVHGNSVAGHLFSVASGLESVVVGEGEIAGQVRRALEHARGERTTTPELERLFQNATRTSREVKNRTGVGGAGRSLVRLALDLASGRVTDWAAARVLLIGTGQYAGATLAALRDRGVTDVRVFSPSGRATKFAASHDIAAVARAEFPAVAAAVDVIITCTTVEHHVVDRAIIERGRAAIQDASESTALAAFRVVCPVPDAAREARTLLIDLGMPRNIAPDVLDLDGIELLDLETIRIHAPIEELGATDAARAIVSDAAREFSVGRHELDLAPTVVALRQHVESILESEIERARDRGDADGSAEAALRHMAGVLLHAPMVRAKDYARAGEPQVWADGVTAVFGISPEASDRR
ncbi:MAG TPA: glutamyl-tRNA reductase [Candidatus Lumbricidophila sp.]|nr:glutamyl-tRNA reductase [Candidatus Lumbricidophila sp.]